MVPFGNKTVTLVKRHANRINGKLNTAYSKHIVKNCSWSQAARWVLYGDEKRLVTEITCRIPAGQAVPQADDYVFLGVIRENIETTEDVRRAMANHKGEAVQVQYVADNAHNALPMAHYACRGS